MRFPTRAEARSALIWVYREECVGAFAWDPDSGRWRGVAASFEPGLAMATEWSWCAADPMTGLPSAPEAMRMVSDTQDWSCFVPEFLERIGSLVDWRQR